MEKKSSISCCIITFNEEHNIRECLESVSWADEIVVVDGHSTDATRSIAREYTDRVIEHDFEGHIQQKNFVVDQARNLWVLCVDADERVTPELKEEILRVMRNHGEVSGFSMPRLVFYLGRFIRHGGWYPDRKLRLFRKDRGRWGGRNPHDHVEIQGATEVLRGDLLHYTYRNVTDHLERINSHTRIVAAEMAKEGRRAHVTDLVFRAPVKFFKMYVLKRGFLGGVAGLVIAVLGSYYVFLKYAKLWETGWRGGRKADSHIPSSFL